MTNRYKVETQENKYGDSPVWFSFRILDSETGEHVAGTYPTQGAAEARAKALGREAYRKSRESVVFQVSGFPGWYGSWLDSELDHQIERDSEYIANGQDSEYYANDSAANFNFPEPLKLSESDVSDLYFRQSFCEYREARNLDWLETLANELTDQCESAGDSRLQTFWRVAVCALGYSLKYESMSSPREYNFTTDRLFAFGRLQAFRVMLRLARRPEYRDAWAAIVSDRHSSRDGFISFYDSDAESWGADIREYDHNQLATLFAFALESCGVWDCGGRRGNDSAWDRLNDSICESMLNTEDSAFHEHCQIGGLSIAAARGEKLCDWLETERDESGQWAADCESLVWLATNPDSDVVNAAREHDSALINAAIQTLALTREGITIPCDKTPDMFAASDPGRDAGDANGESA